MKNTKLITKPTKKLPNIPKLSLLTLLAIITFTGCSNNTKTRLDNHAEKINDLEYKIERLESRIKDLEQELDASTYTYEDYLEESEESDENSKESSSNTDSSSEIYTSSPVYLSNGSYEVGVDISAGTYDLTAISGYGLLTGDLSSGFISQPIGIAEGRNNETYKNLKLTTGDTFEIKSGVEIKFAPK